MTNVLIRVKEGRLIFLFVIEETNIYLQKFSENLNFLRPKINFLASKSIRKYEKENTITKIKPIYFWKRFHRGDEIAQGGTKSEMSLLILQLPLP